MREHHLGVTRTARYFTLGEPGPATREVWFVCHGYGQLAGRFLRHFEALDDGRRLIVAPEGVSRFYLDRAGREQVGASWMTKEDRLVEIEDYVRYLDALHGEIFATVNRSAVRVWVLGFSQGVATACRWVARGAVHADRLVLWGGTLPPELDFGVGDAFRRAELVIIAGVRDEFITPQLLATETARLEQQGVPFTVRTFEGGHELDETLLTELAAD